MFSLEDMRRKKEQLGLSYEQIAEMSGVPLATVQKVFGGTTKSPRYATMTALAKALDLGSGSEAAFQEFGMTVATGEKPQGVYDTNGKTEPMMLGESSFVYGTSPHKDTPHMDTSLNDTSLKDTTRKDKPRKLTRADRDALPEERRTELIDGVLYDMAAPRPIHQLIAALIHTKFMNFVMERGGPCIPFIAPTDVILDNDKYTAVQPDVFVVCDRDKIKDAIYRNPDLVIEVLSPSTRKKDLTLKYWKYFNAGVREYWIIDPKKQTVIVYNFEAIRDPANESATYAAFYTFDSEIPVQIWNGECVVDMKIIKNMLESLNLL